MTHSMIGRVGEGEELGRIFVDARQSGCVLYGPYIRLSPGRYRVEFAVDVDPDATDASQCCTVDVVADWGRKILQVSSLHVEDLRRSSGIASLQFEVENEAIFEFRLFSLGKCSFSAAIDRPLKKVDLETGIARAFDPPWHHSSNPLYRERLDAFSFFESIGMAFDVTADLIICKFKGIEFEIKNSEDCAVVNEIFCINGYNFRSSGEKLLIDIGMNAGITSLYFANNPTVKEVHAFEPFAAPFNRALQNFERNTHISNKISPNHFGLGESDRQMDVLASQDHTIGTSINGLHSGVSEKITIKDAASVIGPLASRAKAAGLELFVKMDCEGSEFGIFESLSRAGLLSSIDAMAIEWHKWWSADKTQADLIEPMISNGFVVLDQTQPSNPHAGMLYAVNTKR